MDIYPLTIRGPLQGTRQSVVTFARMFTHEGHMYIAQSRDKGRTVTSVNRYDLPEGEPSRPGRQAKWGEFVYSTCGCGNHWGSHSIASLVARVSDAPST